MDEVNEALGISKVDESVQPDNKGKEGESSQEEKVTVNGREYTAKEFKTLATDTENLVRKLEQQGQELGELRKLKETATTSREDDITIDPVEEAKAKKLWKKMGFLTKEEADEKDYIKSAVSKIKEVSTKYKIDEKQLAQELDSLGVKIPVEKIENIYMTNHPDEYLKYKEEQKKADTVVPPFTMQPNRGVSEPTSQTPVKFGQNVVNSALELLGIVE